jgi:hypothetical protein
VQRDVYVLRVSVLCARMKTPAFPCHARTKKPRFVAGLIARVQQSRSGSRKMLASASVANAEQWETMGLGCTKNKHDY